jgi:hypothetical protein
MLRIPHQPQALVVMSAMPHERIFNQACPKCGGAMERGYITGQATRLRWCEKPNTKTIFAGKPLRKKRTFWSAPTIEAVRCKRCKIGMFTYDN